MLEHGGRLRQAAQRYGVPLGDWLDLSTGIAPFGYPVPPPSAASWRRLPEDEDGLEEAARACYGTDRLLALPGSQAAIQALPRLRPSGEAAVLAPSYAEHRMAWQAAGHELRSFKAAALEDVAATADVVVIGNPNNPDGMVFQRDRLLAAAALLARRGGWLVVDEAFADAEPANSLAPLAGCEEAANVIVLRSLGKFFGLAGARVGFAIAAAPLLARLREAVGPWPIAHPAREAARVALADLPWQSEQRHRIGDASLRLAGLLREAGLGESAGTALFRYIETPKAEAMFGALAQRGILVRRFAVPAALRFGLPGEEGEWRQLTAALAEI